LEAADKGIHFVFSTAIKQQCQRNDRRQHVCFYLYIYIFHLASAESLESPNTHIQEKFPRGKILLRGAAAKSQTHGRPFSLQNSCLQNEKLKSGGFPLVSKDSLSARAYINIKKSLQQLRKPLHRLIIVLFFVNTFFKLIICNVCSFADILFKLRDNFLSIAINFNFCQV